MDEVENLRGRNVGKTQVERFGEEREFVERDEIDRPLVGGRFVTDPDHNQDVRKACDPTTWFRIHSCDNVGTANIQGAGVIRRRG